MTSTRVLRLVEVRPHVSYADGLFIVGQLKAAGVSLWSPEDHAALMDTGWIDVEALDGD